MRFQSILLSCFSFCSQVHNSAPLWKDLSMLILFCINADASCLVWCFKHGPTWVSFHQLHLRPHRLDYIYISKLITYSPLFSTWGEAHKLCQHTSAWLSVVIFNWNSFYHIDPPWIPSNPPSLKHVTNSFDTWRWLMSTKEEIKLFKSWFQYFPRHQQRSKSSKL